MTNEKIITSYKILKWKRFKDVLSGLHKLCTEGIIKFDESGLRIRTMDNANCAMIDLHLDATLFVESVVGKETKIKTNFALLNSALSKGKMEDILSLKYTSPMEVSFEGKKNMSFKIPNMDFDEKEGKRKEFTTKGFECVIPISLWNEWIDASEFASESTIYVEVNPTSIICTTGCYNVGSDEKNKGWREETPIGEITIAQVNPVRQSVMVWLSLDYLKAFMKIMSFAEKCTVKFIDNHYPVVFEVREDGLSIDLILAPRVPNDV